MGLTSIKLPEFKPPKGSGLEQLGRLLKRAYNSYTLANRPGENKNKPPIKKYQKKQATALNRIAAKDPIEVLKDSVQSLSRSLNNAIGQIVKKPEVINYDNIVKGFMPANAELLKPGYPRNSQELLQADLDGDGRNELIATYKTDEGIRTLILKGQGDKWQKAADIYHQAHENIHYRSVVRLSGQSRPSLLVGMTGGDSENTLYGYSLSDGAAVRLFSRGYSWMELVRKPKNTSRSGGGETLSFWNRAEDGHYNIEVMDWTGSQLEKTKDDTYYYRTRVAPYYLRRAKQNPSNISGWYRLAEAFVKAGATKDAMIVADAGSRQNQDLQFKEKFLAMKKDLSGKFK